MSVSRKQYWALSRYGITERQYDRKLEQQGNQCYVCGKQGDDVGSGLCLDHDHQTGVLRKFLCPRCNMLVGFRETNEDIFMLIEAYISEHHNWEE